MWHQALDDNGAIDYPALLEKSAELLGVASVRRQIRRLYTAIVVDEAQNLTRAQYELITALATDDGKVSIPVMLVGDDKQSIVSFAGADPNLMGKFETELSAERHELTTNFRSAAALTAAANSVASALGHPTGTDVEFAAPGLICIETLPSESDEGTKVANWVRTLLTDGIPSRALGEDENSTLRPEDIAVLSRSAAGLRPIASALDKLGIAYALSSTPNDWLTTSAGKIVLEIIGLSAAPSHHSTYWELSRLLGTNFPEKSLEAVRSAIAKSEDRLVRAVEGVAHLPEVSDLLPFLQDMELPTGLEDSEAANWQNDLLQFSSSWAQFDALNARSDLTWANFKLHCARVQRGDDLARGVRLLTVHKAQGREYAAVALVGLNEGQFPDFRATSESALKDELRTFYVAITRSRRILLLTRPAVRDTRYGPRSTRASSFLGLLPA